MAVVECTNDLDEIYGRPGSIVAQSSPWLLVHPILCGVHDTIRRIDYHSELRLEIRK
jgi:hypothetical protein